ncbi:Uncharacterised protein r2_g2240 [Pycnogonum litorale]
MSVNWTDFRVDFLAAECVRNRLTVPPGATKADLVGILEGANIPKPQTPATEEISATPGAVSGEFYLLVSKLMEQLNCQQQMMLKLMDVKSERTPELPKLDRSLGELNGDNIDEYFSIFDKISVMQKWSDEVKLNVIIAKLTGRARALYLSLTNEEMTSYTAVRDALLKRFKFTPEAYRRQFRSLVKAPNESYSEFAHRLYALLMKWLTPVDELKDHSDFKRIIHVLGLEQFTNSVPSDLKIWLMDKKVADLFDAADLADEFCAARYGEPQAGSSASVSHSGQRRLINYRTPDGTIGCNRCQLPGHVARVCPSRADFAAQRDAHVAAVLESEVPDVDLNQGNGQGQQ